MSKTIIARKFTFDAGHRIYGHESKCNNLHGHRYELEVFLSHQQDKLDNLGRVIDFGTVKKLFGDWIDKTLDHKMILEEKDPFVQILKNSWIAGFGAPPFIVDFPPTAENLAKFIFLKLSQILFFEFHHDLQIESVTLHETEKCSATFTMKNN